MQSWFNQSWQYWKFGRIPVRRTTRIKVSCMWHAARRPPLRKGIQSQRKEPTAWIGPHGYP